VDGYRSGDQPDTWVASGQGWSIRKTYQIEADTLSVSFLAEGKALPALIETELNLALPELRRLRRPLCAGRRQHSRRLRSRTRA
jgi:hypothetical protein